MKLKKLLFVGVGCGLLAAPSVGAITQGPTYYEYKGFECVGFSYAESDGTTLTMELANRPTGWKVGSVYRAKDGNAANMYFGSEDNLNYAVNEGCVKDATDTATISETMVLCPVGATYPIPVIRYEPYQYTIAFDANASPVSGAMALQTGLSYTNTTTTLRTNVFTRAGYAFAGWTTNSTGTGTVFADQTTVGGEKFGVTQDGQTVTLYAKWEANTYKVSCSANGGTADSSWPTSATYDAAFRVSAPTRTGYTFVGWTVSGHNADTAMWGASEASVSSSIQQNTISTSGDIWLKNLTPTAGATVTLTARWTAKSYTITYNEAGGTAGSSRPKSATYDTAFKVSAPTRTGYTFLGWTVTGHDATTARYGTSSSSVASTLPSGGQITASGDIWLKNLTSTAGATVTLTARWSERGYKVAYNEADGTAGASRPTAVAYDMAFQVSAPTRTGYTFQGWTVSGHNADTAMWGASEASVSSSIQQNIISTSGDIWLKNLTSMAGATVTLTARWKVITCHVTFSAEGGQNGTASIDVDYGQTASGFATIVSPERANYTFQGYYTEREGKGTRYFDEGGYLLKTWDIAATACTLYAHWTNSVYIVRFDGNGQTGGTMADQTIPFNESTALTSNAFARTGYTFAGWAQTNTPTRVSFSDGATVTDLAARAGDVVRLLAVWTTNTYYVAFDANGGEGTMPPLTNLYDRAFTLPANQFTHSNTFMVFSVWRDAATGLTYAEGAEAVNLTNAPFAAVTLQAVWTNRLSSLSRAMHCDNLDWQNDSADGNLWQVYGQVYEGSGVGHGSDSCVRQANGPFAKQRILWAKVEPKINESGKKGNVSGTLSFWWKPTGAATTLQGGWSSNLGTKWQLSLTAPADTWTNVTMRIEAETSDPQYLGLINATPSGDGFCCIDGMTWTPDGENPTPGESDRVEVASVTPTADGLALSFTGDARFAYHLLATDSLLPMNWYDFGPTNVGTGAAQTFDIPFDAAAPQRFFRIETIQKPTP